MDAEPTASTPLLVVENEAEVRWAWECGRLALTRRDLRARLRSRLLPGVVVASQGAVRLALSDVMTRLAATELEEQALRLIEILIWLAMALFFLGIAVVFAAVLVVLLFWDSNRLLAAGLLAALFVAIGAGAALIARARLRERPKLLAATLAELERDRETLDRP